MVVMAVFLCPKTADAQTREVAFSADEGTWLSLDVSTGARPGLFLERGRR
jgi:hypothetical protein